MRISDELYLAYKPEEAKDLRLEHFVVSSDGLGLLYKKMHGRTFVTPDMSDVFVLRTSEAYLNLAEAAACGEDEVTARKALNDLRERRIRREAFDEAEVNALSGEELVRFIREERQRELCLEGHRWFDMIRINNGNYAIEFLKSIGKNQVTKERLLLPIPQTEMDSNNLMTQNPGY